MNTAQRQLLLFGSLMTVLLAPYFNPLRDSAWRRLEDIKNRADALDEARMRVICPRPPFIGKPFLIHVFVKSPYREQTATLYLAPGLSIVAGESVSKPVPQPEKHGYYSLVTWKVLATVTGELEVRAEVPGIPTARERIQIREPFG